MSESKDAEGLSFGVWFCIIFWMLIMHGCMDHNSKIDKNKHIKEMREEIGHLERRIKELERWK